jgi:hypothetical protein
MRILALSGKNQYPHPVPGYARHKPALGKYAHRNHGNTLRIRRGPGTVAGFKKNTEKSQAEKEKAA